MQGEPTGRRSPKTKPPERDPDERLRHVLSIVLMLAGVLTFLALISYTPLDQANADLRPSDLTGLVTNDPIVSARADTTHNWLGLVGALIADVLVNGMLGYWMLVCPVLLGIWSISLFRGSGNDNAVRVSLFTILAALIIASLMGTAQLVTWMPHPSHEWSGAIGAFISTMLRGLIGTAGSMLLLLVALVITSIYAFDVDVREVALRMRTVMSRFREWRIRYSDRKRTDSLGGRIGVENVLAPSVKNENDSIADEPARMTRRIRKGDGVLSPPAEPRIERHGGVEGRSSRSPLPELSEAAPAEQRVVPATPRPEESANPVANATTVKPQKSSQEMAVQSPSEEHLVDVVRGETEHVESATKSTPRLILNVQEGETEADLEVRNKGAILARIPDEEISYTPPPISLLVPQNEHEEVDDDELKENGRILQEKLATFNIQIEDLTVTPGPVVTLYEFVPAAGIKIAQIESLADDIALALKARGIRIIAPIPGKGTVGVEIPNHRPSMVRIRSVLNTAKFREANFRLPLALGKTTIGEVFCDDLTKMPHLLIAGATGSGKSVGINAIIASLMYKMHPRDLKLVIIDPKKIELAQYRSLTRHFLAQCPDIDEDIITTPQNAVMALRSLEMEMDRRYDILAKGRQRNIADYNQKVTDGAYDSVVDFDHRKLPYVVVILDELADLMITARGEVEEPIARLAQLARAVGIHLVLATQRPSVDVITGTIKANFPARIAYQVASKIDSRTILDMSGAEYLLGNGDMLYLPGGSPKPLRLQNAFITTEEVEAICAHIGEQVGYTTPYVLPSVQERKRAGAGGGEHDRDDLFEEAARLVVRHQQGSVSLVQRRLKVGYSRAARIIDELEMAGVVGPFDGSKARQVLIEDEDDLELYL